MVAQSDEYEDWRNHLDSCAECTDWYMKKMLEQRNVDISEYPCVHVAYYSTSDCGHDDPWECDVVLIRSAAQFGLPVRDGGRSVVRISHCPWCGTNVK